MSGGGKPLFPVLRQAPRAMVLTTMLAAAGGGAAYALHWPLPWMIGPMAVVMAAALAGFRVIIDPHVRMIMIYVIGVMIGSAFQPRILDGIATWTPTLLGLFGYVVFGTFASGLYLVKVARFDRHTAFFSAFPGGLTQMTIIGGAIGADERAIAISHAVRIVIVVAAIPLFFSVGLGLHRPDLARVSLIDLGGFDGAMMLASIAIGAAIGHFARIPAGFIIGPMAASAAFHMAGVTAARPPDELVAAAQVILGASIGCRFAGARLGSMLRTALHSIVAAALLLAVTAIFVITLAPMTPVGMEALILAYAPGGLTEMSLIALALGLDLAFISTHHVVRIVLIALIGPLFARIFVLRMNTKNTGAKNPPPP